MLPGDDSLKLKIRRDTGEAVLLNFGVLLLLRLLMELREVDEEDDEGKAGKFAGRLRLNWTPDVVEVVVKVFVSAFLFICSKRIISSSSCGVGVRRVVISVIRAV